MKSILYVLLDFIHGSKPEDTYYQLARFFLDHIEQVPYWSLEKAALKSQTSPSTINRFMKHIGYMNYSSFREIAQKQGNSLEPVSASLDIQALNIAMQEIEAIPLWQLKAIVHQIQQAQQC